MRFASLTYIQAVPFYNSSMLPIYRRLAGKLPSIVVYNGDTDPDVQFQGTEDAVRGVGLPVAKGGAWRPWFYRQQSAPLELLAAKPPFWGSGLSHRPLPAPQLGGYVTNYASNVTFVTIHGSGHLVPMFKPQVALHLFERLLGGGALSPPLDASELEALSDDAFFGDGFMTRWVEAAQKHEYAESSALNNSKDNKATAEGSGGPKQPSSGSNGAYSASA
jgi:serine carboxypeptidase-like clade 1